MTDEVKDTPNAEETKQETQQPTDEKEQEAPGLRIGIGIDEESSNVVIGFGKDVSWISFRPDEAVKFGQMVLNKGEQQLKVLEEKAKSELAGDVQADEAKDEPVPETPASETPEEGEPEPKEAPAEEEVPEVPEEDSGEKEE